MSDPPAQVVVGYGEIGTKSATVRREMVEGLASNLAAVLNDRGIDADVEQTWARLYVHLRPGCTTEQGERAAAAVAEVPGVVWARPAWPCEPTLPAICECLRAVASCGHDERETFAVRASRTGPRDAHDFRSGDIEREGGDAVQTTTGAAVDLDDPDDTYRVECREHRAHVSRTEYDGVGGLPVGTQGTVVALISGGIDSPVAAWQLLRRGCEVVPVYVDLGSYGGADHRARAIETIAPLARRAPQLDMRPRVVPGGEVVERLVSEVRDTRMLSLRRAMLTMAAVIAEAEGADAVATGESLGQKSSQTGPNLAVTDAAVGLPVHRPLLTWDKAAIVDCARELGTFGDSTLPVGCERVAPHHPETAATLRAVERAESPDLLELAAAAARERTIVEAGTDR